MLSGNAKIQHIVEKDSASTTTASLFLVDVQKSMFMKLVSISTDSVAAEKLKVPVCTFLLISVDT